jgi:UDP-N-acetylglucosamine--N-acetylmuramyl-(pentapeptide) pyrophosphoryl-undecaprenol N-acetylglucosamine transferase
VLATGGYASAPCVLAARLAGVPVVVAEQNAVLGAANRLAVRVGAAAVATSFEDTALPARSAGSAGFGRRRGRSGRHRRVVLTGNPVRRDVLAVDRESQRDSARARLGLPLDRRVVLVYGGSLGARRLNQATVGARRHWRDRADVAVRHVIGDRDWSLLAGDRAPRPDEALVYQPVRYEDAMPTCFAAADLVICRAGASTVAELTAVGLPSVLVPLPGAPGDHQTANAHVLERAGAAILLPDDACNGDRLAATVDALLADPRRLEAMARAAAALGRRDAAERVADLLLETAAPRTLPGRPADAGPGSGAAGAGDAGRDDHPTDDHPTDDHPTEDDRAEDDDPAEDDDRAEDDRAEDDRAEDDDPAEDDAAEEVEEEARP